jgi:hypothetical protein
MPDMPDDSATFTPTGDWKLKRLGRGHIPRPQTSVMVEYMTTEREGAPIPRVVMFRDSFGATLMPFLSEIFGHVEYRWRERHYFDYRLVDQEYPDVVCIEFVERAIQTWWMPSPIPPSAIPLPGPDSCYCKKPWAASLPGCHLEGGAAQSRGGGLIVKKATWGSTDGDPTEDITKAIAAQVADDQVSFAVDVNSLGDVAPGEPKQLVVDYERNGISGRKVVTEGGVLLMGARR